MRVRLQGLNKELEWDGEKMEFTNIGDNEKLRMVLSNDGLRSIDGDPQLLQRRTDPFSCQAVCR